MSVFSELTHPSGLVHFRNTSSSPETLATISVLLPSELDATCTSLMWYMVMIMTWSRVAPPKEAQGRYTSARKECRCQQPGQINVWTNAFRSVAVKVKFTHSAAAHTVAFFFSSFFGDLLAASALGVRLSSARPFPAACLAVSHSETLESLQRQLIEGSSRKHASRSSVSDVLPANVSPGETGVHIWKKKKINK